MKFYDTGQIWMGDIGQSGPVLHFVRDGRGVYNQNEPRGVFSARSGPNQVICEGDQMAAKDCKPLPPLSDKILTRFWSSIDKGGPDDCWLWNARAAYGYGRLPISGGYTVGAHRVAFLLYYGVDPFPLHVCHKCDIRYPLGDLTNRRCCNGAHLFTGTQADNMADMCAKGRNATGLRSGVWTKPERRAYGERSSTAVLRAQDVLTIRDRYASGKTTQRVLALEYNVDPSTISRVVRVCTWIDPHSPTHRR